MWLCWRNKHKRTNEQTSKRSNDQTIKRTNEHTSVNNQIKLAIDKAEVVARLEMMLVISRASAGKYWSFEPYDGVSTYNRLLVHFSTDRHVPSVTSPVQSAVLIRLLVKAVLLFGAQDGDSADDSEGEDSDEDAKQLLGPLQMLLRKLPADASSANGLDEELILPRPPDTSDTSDNAEAELQRLEEGLTEILDTVSRFLPSQAKNKNKNKNKNKDKKNKKKSESRDTTLVVSFFAPPHPAPLSISLALSFSVSVSVSFSLSL